ncbi:hypothetical protein FRC02_004798 [Tulasnella sp. 418]|nr:hypothetical protein FRC02_004798 [Tulasnella sp. 418]
MDVHVFILLEWCRQNGVWMDSRLVVKPEEDDGDGARLDPGITVFSSKPIPDQTTVVQIPRYSILSVKSSELSDLITEVASLYLKDEPNMVLALALLTEIKLGTDSRWWGYIQSLPQKTVDIATFWSSQDETDAINAIQWLKGTQVQKFLDKEQVEARLKTFYVQISEPLCRSLGWECTYEDMRYAYSLVSSRAFHVDAYHGISMVPIADAFNHVENNHVHLETDYFVCSVCGSLDQCIHDDGTEGRPTQSTSDEDTCDMVTNVPIEANEEIFNTYDSHLSNAQLLCHYGFSLEGNANDEVTWDLVDLKHSLNHTNFPSSTAPDSTRLINPLSSTINSFPHDVRHSPSPEARIWELFKALPPTKVPPIESQLIYDALRRRSVESSASATFILSSSATRSIAQGQEEGQGPSFLTHPSALSSTEYCFSVNADGLISHHLFTYLVACKLFLQQSLDNGPTVRSSEGSTVGPLWNVGTDGLYTDVGTGTHRCTGTSVEKAAIEYAEAASWVINDKIGFSPDVLAKISNIWARLMQDVLPQAELALDSESMTTLRQTTGSTVGEIEGYDIALLILCQVARDIQQLCNARVKSIGPSSADELEWDWGDILDATPLNQKRTRLAIAYAISERSFLDTCSATWKEVETWCTGEQSSTD